MKYKKIKKTMIGGVEYANCFECSRIFRFFEEPLCPDCLEADMLLLTKVKDAAHSNLNFTMTEVSNMVGVPVEKIRQYVEKEHLAMTPGFESEKLINCDYCDTPISIGKLCNPCKVLFLENMKKQTNEGKIPDKAAPPAPANLPSTMRRPKSRR
ncbi:MAG: hypothetical protein FWE91_08990 [Defluviitaleaceae bacterium]|nr:hypothetical protein [Defluviitaleaceae bacterium]MCL2837187.1 hypothetical protein [Defluviitaleaceae bacterium]